MAKTISLVVISFNRKDDIERCLSSIREQDKKPDEVIVVDNLSTDGTVEMVRKKFPEVKVIVSPENRGVCYATNIGYVNSMGDYIGIIESDMLLSKNWVREVIKGFEVDDKAGIVCPTFLTKAKDKFVDCEAAPDENGYILMANGSFAIRRDILEKSGQMIQDKDYFLYAQEEEVSARVFWLGYNIKRLPKAQTYHNTNLKEGRSVTKLYFSFQNLMRNNLWNLWRFYSKRNIIIFTPVYMAYFAIKIRNPIVYLKILGKTLAGIPKCIKSRMPVDMDIYKNIIDYANYRRGTYKRHMNLNKRYFKWSRYWSMRNPPIDSVKE